MTKPSPSDFKPQTSDFKLQTSFSLKISSKDLPMVCFVVTQQSESRVSHSVFATPKHLAGRQLKI